MDRLCHLPVRPGCGRCTFPVCGSLLVVLGLFRWCSGKESTCPCRRCKRCKRCGFDRWLGTIFWSRRWWPTPVLLPGRPRGQGSLAGTAEQLSMHAYWWRCLSVGCNPQLSEKFSLSILLGIVLVIHLCSQTSNRKKKRCNPFLDFLFLMSNMTVCFLKSCF